MPGQVLFLEHEVVPRLFQFRLPKEVLQDILDRAAGERASVSLSDPIGTAGTEMRRWSTRFLRDDLRLRSLGWQPCSHSQIEGIRNDQLAMKVAFMNTDARTGMPSMSPHSVSERGSISEQLIQRNCDQPQGLLFAEPQIADPIAQYDFWYLCAHVNEDHIAAELSRPIGLTKSIVNSYSERVILWQPGEKSGFRHPNPIPEDFAQIKLPTLKRR